MSDKGEFGHLDLGFRFIESPKPIDPAAYETMRVTGRSGCEKITVDHIKAVIDDLERDRPAGPYRAYLPRRLANHYTIVYGGRIEPCPLPGMEAYDWIVGHMEGDMIILTGKPAK